jgi:hypothetical protein
MSPAEYGRTAATGLWYQHRTYWSRRGQSSEMALCVPKTLSASGDLH